MNIVFFIAVVKAGLSGKNAEQVLTQLNFVITSLTNNPHFPNPNPTLMELIQKQQELTVAIAAASNGGKHLVETRNDIVGKIRVIFTTLSAYINEVSAGDAGKAITSGLPLRATKIPAHLLGKVLNLRAVPIGNGRIKLIWGGLKGRDNYMVYSTIDPNMQPVWDFRGHTTKIRIILEGFTPGVVYYFKVAGVNNFGQGEFSDYVVVRCL